MGPQRALIKFSVGLYLQRRLRDIQTLTSHTSWASCMHKELVELRSGWYEAYIKGDVTRLATIEGPEFIVVGPHGVEEPSKRLNGISEAVKAGRWFPHGSQAVDESLSWQAISPDVVIAFGVGQIETPRGMGSTVKFTELWKRASINWQVVHLHYSELAP